MADNELNIILLGRVLTEDRIHDEISAGIRLNFNSQTFPRVRRSHLYLASHQIENTYPPLEGACSESYVTPTSLLFFFAFDNVPAANISRNF